MLDKNLFRLFTNSMILIILGLFFNIKTIRAEKYNKCYSLFYSNFEQYYWPWKYDGELYLEKYGQVFGSQFGFGNIEELIDFKRSFYLKLIDNYEKQSFLSTCHKNYGIAVVFGPYRANSYTKKKDDKFLVEDLQHSVVVIFKVQDKQVDILDCRTSSCKVSKPINHAKFYELSNDIHLNVYILYDAKEKKLQIYKYDYNYKSNLLLEQQIDLTENLIEGNGYGYIGITSTDKRCYYNYNLIGSSICHSGEYKITPEVKLLYGQETAYPKETIIIPPNQKFSLIIEYKSEYERDLMGQGYITQDGRLLPLKPTKYGNGYILNLETENVYTEIVLSYHNLYEHFDFNIKIQSKEISMLNYAYGKDPNEGQCYEKIDEHTILLKYGSLKGTGKCGGDFDLSEFKDDNYLYFYVKGEDEYGNPCEIQDMKDILDKLENESRMTLKLEKTGYQYTYKLGVKVNNKGNYYLRSNILNYEIRFNVKNLVPSSTYSKCHIDNFSQKAYNSGVSLNYICEFMDEDNGKINVEESKEAKDVKFNSLVYRLVSDKKSDKTFKPDENCYDNICIYTYKTEYNGKYSFETQFGIDDMTEVKSEGQNIFYVSPEPTTLDGSRFNTYPLLNNWVSIDDLDRYYFTYDEESPTRDVLFLIDLVDIKDPNRAYYSEIEQAYEYINLENLVGNIVETHSTFDKTLNFSVYTDVYNKKYILVKLEDSKNKMRRSSLAYYASINFGREANVSVKYHLDHIGGYQACGKELNESASFVGKLNGVSVKAGEQTKVGYLILKTDEEHLYNYFLTNKSQIELSVDNAECKSCKIDFSNSNIYGVYDLIFYSEKKGEYKISAKINGKNLLEGHDSFTVNVDSYDQAYTLEKIDLDDSSRTAGKEVKLGFKIKDRYDNYLNYPFDNDYFGLSYNVTLDDKEHSSRFFKMEKSEEENVYYIKENDINSGNYKVILKTKHSSSSIAFEYKKDPANAHTKYSRARLLNKNQLSIGEKSSAEVELYDEYYNKIDPDSEQYGSELKNVEIYAINTKGNKIEYKRNGDKGDIFITEQITIAGFFELGVKINGKEIENYESWQFEVIDFGFDFSKSQLKMIGDKVLLMSENGYYTLYNGLQRPSFEFDFLTIEGLPSGNVDRNTGIEAKFYSTELDKKSVEELWISNNKLLWILPDNITLENNKLYTFEIKRDITSRKYYLFVTNYGEDKSSSEEVSILKTLVSPNVLYLKAGISDFFVVELKGEDNLRFDKTLVEGDLHLESSCPSVSTNVKLGNKKGQYNVYVLSNSALDFYNNCNISMRYQSQDIKTEVLVIASPGELDHFSLDGSALNQTTAGSDLKLRLYPKDKYDNQIKDNLFDKREFSEESFSYLLNAKHSSGYKVSLTSTTNPVSHYIEITLSCEKSGIVTLSSIYLQKEIKIEILAGKGSKYSIGYLEGKKGQIEAGTNRSFVIEPKDKNGNKLTDIEAIKEIIENYSVKVYDESGKEIPEVAEVIFNDKEGKIEYVIQNKVSGTKVIKAYYNNEEIINENNVIHVVNGSPDITKTKLIYNDKEYSLDEELKLSLASLPIIDVQLYDQYNNKVNNLKDLGQMNFQLNVSNEQLLNDTFYNNYIRLYIDEKKVDKYFEIKKTETASELVFEIEPYEKRIIKVIFEDESPKKDEEQPKYFILNTNNLVLKVGEEGLLSLTFYTEKGKPMGHFFDSTLDISVSCSDDKKVNTEIYYGKYYGTYNILVSSTTVSNGLISCSINVQDMKNEFSLRVLPDTLKYCQVSQDPLPEAKAGETYEIKLECFDKTGNKGYLDDELFGGRIINPKGETIELKGNSNEDGSYSLYIEPTFEGNYIIQSEYLFENITFETLPGKISGENSYVNMQKNVNAGGKIDVDIVVMDKYNNLVKLNEGDMALFNLYYRYRENNKYIDYTKVDSKPELVKDDEGKYVIRYSQTVNKDGINEFRGIYENTVLKCSNCETNVAAGEFDLTKSEVYKYNTFSMTYTKLDKENDVLYNEDENLFIRVYPKDSYGNNVSPKDLKDISITISGITIKDFTLSEEYIEFQEINGKFSELENGQYDLVITYGDTKVTYPVRVSGKDGFSEDVDYSKTKLLDSNLDFTAGKYGYFNFELRDSNNVRAKNAKVGKVSVNSDFEIKVLNSQSSTILVLVTSTKANVFPNKGETKLNVLIDGKEVLSGLKLIINPDELEKAEINSKYIVSDGKLSPVTTDDDLRFSLIGYDSYGNIVLLSANEAKLKVKSLTKDFSYKSSFVNIITGEQNYLYQITTVGEYTITAGNNSKDGQLFEKDYSLSVTPGEISLEKTSIISYNNEVEAGDEEIISISPKDKNNNNVELNEDILSEFSAYLLSSDYEITKASQNIYTSFIFYVVVLNKAGNYAWNVQYNKRKIKFDKNTIHVKPSSCKPENTLIYFKDKNGEYIELNTEKDNKAYSSYASPLSLHLIFRDSFSNVIEGDTGIEVKEAYLSGNNMKQLEWKYRNGYLELEDKSLIENLVSRTGDYAYIFSFTIKVNEDKKKFEIKVNHFGVKDEEEGYGNGDYDLKKSEVEPEIAKFRVGTYYDVLLKLKTEEGLLYYGDFSPENINCDNLENGWDRTFKCFVSQKDKGKYTIRYYTELLKKETDNIYNVIRLTNPQTRKVEKEIKVLLVNRYGIPYKNYTEIIKSIEPTTDENKELVLEFKLKDQFGNAFDSSEIIDYLVIENNGINTKSPIVYNNDNTYRATIKPQYPPKEINIQMYYVENSTKIEILPAVQKSTFNFDLDYSNTIVNSKNINRMKAGDYLDLNIILYDKKMNCYVDESYNPSLLSVTVQGPLEKKAELRTYHFERFEDTKSECKYIYKVKIDQEERYVETGSYSIVVYAVEQINTLATYTQTVVSGDVDINNFKVYYTDMDDKSYNDKNIPAGEEFHFIVQGYDQFMNKIDNVQLPDLDVKVKEFETNNTVLNCYSGTIGYMACSFSAIKLGNYKFVYTYNEETIRPIFEYGPDEVTYVSGACSAEFNQTKYPSEEEIDISSPYNIIINCLDKYKNQVTKGGAKFTSEISLFIETTQTSVDIDYKVKDNEDGTYQISFIPPLEGEYSIYTYLDGNIYDEKKINITGKSCEGQYLCPNIHKCVSDLRDCIPDEYKCDTSEKQEKPFRCNATSEKCVKSMTECDVEGAEKCSYMNTAYPIGKSGYDLCPYTIPIDCKRKYPSYPKICPDGICRSSEKLKPNQRVCPIGKVLCLDLTCADSIDKCYSDWPVCSNTEVRCPDQSCVDDQKNCPTTITCANENDVVCPDGTCVENEIYCAKLKNCPEETPYLCSDNSCATKPESCPHSIACGHGKSLCSDLICRETC